MILAYPALTTDSKSLTWLGPQSWGINSMFGYRLLGSGVYGLHEYDLHASPPKEKTQCQSMFNERA